MAKKTGKSVTPAKELTPDELERLAHEGTKEAMAKIEKYIKAEKDSDKRAYGEMALEECEICYCEPVNEKEEDDLMLCELIRQREQDVDDLLIRAEAIDMRLKKLLLEKKVHEKVLAKNKSKKEAWQHNWMTDFVTIEEQELQEIEDEIAYDEAWISEAKKMITTKRYKNIPARYLEHFNFNIDSDLDENDDYCSYCDDESCDCEEECGEWTAEEEEKV